MRGAVWVGLVVAGSMGCRHDRARDSGLTSSTAESAATADTGSTGDTGDTGTTEPDGLSARCEVDPANVLRYWCDVHVVPARPVEIAYQDAAGDRPERVRTSPVARVDHRIGLYFFAAETAYTFTARVTDDPAVRTQGAFVTGSLPEGASAQVVTFDGVPSSPILGFGSPCVDGAYAVLADPISGKTIWYHDFQTGLFGFLDAVSFTEDQTVLAIADGVVTEVDLLGNRLLEVLPGLSDGVYAHHDVFRRDGLTYFLFQEVVELPYGEYLLDGFEVYDRGGNEVGEWHLIDYFTPPDPGAQSLYPQDYSHANAIWVDEDLEVTLSLRHLSAIASIDGDPFSPTFGDIRWRLAHPSSAFGNDFQLSGLDPVDFEQQHNAYWLPDGHLTFLDNRVSTTENTRVVEMSVDPISRQAIFLKAWTLPQHCDFQGAAWRTPNGNPLATCAPTAEGFEFDAAGGEVVWHGQASCAAAFSSYVPRLVPVDW